MTDNTKRNAAIRALLTERETLLFDELKRGTPKGIKVLFDAINVTPGIYSRRDMQMRLGGIVSRMNVRLTGFGLRCVSGEPVGTYRIREHNTES